MLRPPPHCHKRDTNIKVFLVKNLAAEEAETQFHLKCSPVGFPVFV